MGAACGVCAVAHAGVGCTPGRPMFTRRQAHKINGAWKRENRALVERYFAAFLAVNRVRGRYA